MELIVKDYELPVIQSNFEEIKSEIVAKTETYKNIVYTESDIKAAKADRAELNKLKKAINDKRISLQKSYMIPFDTFKKQMDELIQIIDEPVQVIDDQIKAYETKQKEEKMFAVRAKFDELNPFDWLVCDQIFNTKWLTQSVSMATIEEDMKLAFKVIEDNLKSLTGLEYAFEAQETYKTTLSLSQAINENTRLAELAKKKAELKAREEVKEEPKAEPKAEPKTMEEPREWMELKVKINSDDFDALQAWLESRGIEWEIK